jgi:dynein heavy chain, axonemal
MKRYNHAIVILKQYQADIAEIWTHQNSWVIEDCLKRSDFKFNNQELIMIT